MHTIQENTISTLDIGGFLDQGTFEFGIKTATGIVLKDETPEHEWLHLTETALNLYEGHGKSFARCALYVADLLNFGEEKFEERYAQAIDGTRAYLARQQSTIANWRWIAGKIHPSRRRENLTLTHHELVAKLPAEEQEEYLRLADDECLTASELRDRIREAHPGKPKAPKPKTLCAIDTTNEQAVADALAILSEYIATLEELPEAWEPAMHALEKAYRKHFRNNGHRKEEA